MNKFYRHCALMSFLLSVSTGALAHGFIYKSRVHRCTDLPNSAHWMKIDHFSQKDFEFPDLSKLDLNKNCTGVLGTNPGAVEVPSGKRSSREDRMDSGIWSDENGGSIASAGHHPEFSGLDRALINGKGDWNWNYETVTAGEKVSLYWIMTARHRTRIINFWITRNGWSPSGKLSINNLEPLHCTNEKDLHINSGVCGIGSGLMGDEKGSGHTCPDAGHRTLQPDYDKAGKHNWFKKMYIEYQCKIPENYTGPHVIVSDWRASDTDADFIATYDLNVVKIGLTANKANINNLHRGSTAKINLTVSGLSDTQASKGCSTFIPKATTIDGVSLTTKEVSKESNSCTYAGTVSAAASAVLGKHDLKIETNDATASMTLPVTVTTSETPVTWKVVSSNIPVPEPSKPYTFSYTYDGVDHSEKLPEVTTQQALVENINNVIAENTHDDMLKAGVLDKDSKVNPADSGNEFYIKDEANFTQIKVKVESESPVVEPGKCGSPVAGKDEWEEKSYPEAGAEVVHNGFLWKSSYYANRGDEPGKNVVWQLVDAGHYVFDWNDQQAYEGGAVVKHDGSFYKAKWWAVKADEPSIHSSVWEQLDGSDKESAENKYCDKTP